MSDPRTTAGRALLDELVNRAGKPNDRLIREQIVAIEDEAFGLYACGQILLGGRCDRPMGHYGVHEKNR